MKRLESGFAILFVLQTLALAGIIYAALLWRSSFGVKLSQSARHSMQATEQAFFEAASKLTSGTAGSARFLCSNAKSESGLANIDLSACAIQNLASASMLTRSDIDGTSLPSPELFPLLDLNVIFNSAASCPSVYGSAPHKTPSGFALTSTALTSKSLCTALPAAKSRVLGNLYLAHGTVVGNSALAIIAANGFIDILGTLDIAGPALVLASGDVHIQSIRSNAAVTIVSASGSIAIGNEELSPRLKTIAWLGAQLPSPNLPIDNGIYPPLRPLEPLFAGLSKELLP